jgi:hypothetical protein
MLLQDAARIIAAIQTYVRITPPESSTDQHLAVDGDCHTRRKAETTEEKKFCHAIASGAASLLTACLRTD